MNNTILRAENISKSFHDGDNTLDILKFLDFSLRKGEMVSILGSSGSGKSTLLHILAGLDSPTAGQVTLNNTVINVLNESAKAKLRNEHLGFVYQFHHLLPEFTALENVAMPLLISGLEFESALEKAEQYLKKVDLGNRAQHKPSNLSGGERQRVAIARALVTKPKCVLADEPTGNLDESNAENVFELLLELNSECNTSLILVTHDRKLANRLDISYELLHGKLKC